MWARYRGVIEYLLGKDVENVSQYNKRARELAKSAIRYLALFSQRQEEKEVAKVLNPKSAGGLINAILGYGSPKFTQRHFGIARLVIQAASAVMRQMLLGDRNWFLIDRTLTQATEDLLGLEKPTGDIRVNQEYAQHRKWIDQDLKSASQNGEHHSPTVRKRVRQ
jgi:hypothetical protein